MRAKDAQSSFFVQTINSALDLTRAIGCRRRVPSRPDLHVERIVMPVASSLIRSLLVSLAALSLLVGSPQARAEDKVLRVGTL
jgi:hypothetical protein